jgi:hypothetical protein
MTNFKKITEQFNEMLARGRIPAMEFQIPNDDYLVVEISIIDDGIDVHFDNTLGSTFFDGIVVEHGLGFTIPKSIINDEYHANLDTWLEFIHSNIAEGYLIPNDLYF